MFTSSLYLVALLSSIVASWCPVLRRRVNQRRVNLSMLIIGRILLGFGIGFANQEAPSISVQEHTGNDKSCVWHALDYADGDLKEELFCIRFASVESVVSTTVTPIENEIPFKELNDGNLLVTPPEESKDVAGFDLNKDKFTVSITVVGASGDLAKKKIFPA